MKVARRRVDVFLAPGQLAVPTPPAYVKTVVGSCVAVCLWDAGAHIGGLNHYLLARPGPLDTPDPRYGSVATPLLIERLRRAGAAPARMQAAVVGGGHPIQSLKDTRIGEENIAVALEVLAGHGIPVVRQETGGAYGRKLLFHTGTGELVVRSLKGTDRTKRPEVGHAAARNRVRSSRAAGESPA